MDVESGLAFLREHQPMPSDFDVPESIADTFAEVIKLFRVHQQRNATRFSNAPKIEREVAPPSK